MREQVCVVAEVLRGEVCDITYTMLAAGRRLAAELGRELHVLLVGHGTAELASNFGAAERVTCVDDPALEHFNPDAHLEVMAGILKEKPPRIILFGHTAMGTDLACGVAERLGTPVIVSCRSLDATDGVTTYTSLTCGGKIECRGPLPDPTCVITLMPGGYPAEDGKAEGSPPVEQLTAPPSTAEARTHFESYLEPEAGDIDIAREPILISVGRGIRSQDNLALAEGLAEKLGGVVAGSRPVVDQGWLPTSRLVGKSGKIVKPKLYLAIGISGAPEHLEGLGGAETTIAINTDEKAPIFDVADYGATVDALELIPKLTERVQVRCGQV